MRPTLIIFILFASLATTGCEGKQEKAARLEKIADDLEQQYRQDCFDPYAESSGQGVSEALHGTGQTAPRNGQQNQNMREQQAKVNSPHCQDLKARKTAASQAWNAALR